MNERPRLLLVDDEPEILVALQDLLELDYDLTALSSPLEALRELQDGGEYALIISDQRMPGMTGDVFLTHAREHSDAAAILLTGYADLTAVTEALNRGGIVGYVAKPWEPGALKAMVAGAVEQRRLRRALEAERALLAGLMEAGPAAVAFKDADGRLLQVNGAKAAQLGLVPSDCIGRTEEELGGPNRRSEELTTLSSGRPKQLVEERSTGGVRSWTLVDYVPILSAPGAEGRLAVVERDVTAEKRAELQLRQSDKLRALGTLAGGVAHDFNNLLTAVLGSLELASRRLENPNALSRYLENARLAAERGAALTQRLLGFSRQTEGAAEIVDVGAILSSMRELVVRTLGGGVNVAWRIEDRLWPCAIEADQFELAVLNLAVNGRDAMPAGGALTIEATNLSFTDAGPVADLTPGDYVGVSVKDEGEGIEPELLQRILEPFFTTKPVGKGTGLGLAMVHGFAQRSGGALEIESEVGRGTVVRIYLPRSEEALSASAGPQVEQTAADVRPGTILVVDDEPSVRSVTAAFLRDLGHEVCEARDGATGLELLRRLRGSIDLALVDFAMPGMNGMDFVEAARREAPSLPCILLTGHFALEAVPEDIAIMQKPFTTSSLHEAVTAALRSGFNPACRPN